MYLIVYLFCFCFSLDLMASDLDADSISAVHLKTVADGRTLLDFSNKLIEEEASEVGTLSLEDVNKTLRKYCYTVTFIPGEDGESSLPIREVIGHDAVGLSTWNLFQRASKGDGVSTPERVRRYKESYKVKISDIKVEFLNFKNCRLQDELFSKLTYYVLGFSSLQSIDLRSNSLTVKSVDELLRIARRPLIKVILLTFNESKGFEFADALAKHALKDEGPGSSIEALLNKFIVATKREISEMFGKSEHWSESWESVHKRFYKM